ncbi:VOC family protein [Streptomyces sp. NPDC051954]|uniref:VOC family protein n=1 Tax=Streptomyces sp. NPDC051954 TaxID=3155524 RepID=UPI00343051D7
MSRIWHIGFAVPDLEQGMAEFGTLFELAWRPVVVRSLTMKDGHGHAHDVDCHVTFSLGGSFAVELWQAIPGTPLAVPESGYFHHIGYWADDHAAEKRRLATLGYGDLLRSDPGLLIALGPGNVRVEPCDLQRDQPYLRDLYPRDSPFAGEPVLPSV